MRLSTFLMLGAALCLLGCPAETTPTDTSATDTGSGDISAADSTTAPTDVAADTAVDTEPPAPECPEPASTLRPGGRSESMGVMDPKRRRLVFFGGDDGAPVNCNPAPHPIGGLWVYDTVCATFEEVQYESGPGPRARGIAAYDSDRDQMLVFGGRYREASMGQYTIYNEVWALNLEDLTWKEIKTTGPAPVARSATAGAYNKVTGEFVVVGGNASDNGLVFKPLNDVWALDIDAGTWREIPVMGQKPIARLFHGAALDSEKDHLYIFGGGDANAWQGPFLGDLWRMDLKTGLWEQMHAGGFGAPAGRIWPTLTWDEVGQRVLLFGGHDDGAIGNNNDTWMFEPASKTWLKLVEPETVNKQPNGFCSFPPDFTIPNMEAPERRALPIAGLDETRGEWVIFGGKTDCGLIDDVWVFSLGQDGWVRLLPATMGEGCLRGENPDLCVAMCK